MWFWCSAVHSDKHIISRGSKRHYAPEALENKNNYVSASDVYSFGNLLYEIANGKKVFSEFSVEEVKQKILMGERPTFRERSDHRILHIVESCWLHNPKLRPTFKEVTKELIKIYSDNA